MWHEIFNFFIPADFNWKWDNAGNPYRKKVNLNDISFPQDFLWGVSTAAHQIEGNCTNNNWFRWEHSVDPSSGKSRIFNGHKSGKACDHWNRYKEDTMLIKDLGCNAYRFSVEWSKIEPKQGLYDSNVIKHYHDEIDLLLKNGIVPMITLHHFTHPLWFEDLGNWEKEENIKYFIAFAERVYEEFSGKVKFWCTINEPTVFAMVGWLQGTFPPGKTEGDMIWNSMDKAVNVVQNLMIAHVQVYKHLKAIDPQPQIGIVHNIFHMRPCRRWNPFDYVVGMVADYLQNDMVIQFFRTGNFKWHIPLIGKKFHIRIPEAPKCFDFFGLNFYSHIHMKVVLDPKDPVQSQASPVEEKLSVMTDMEYPIYAEGIYIALKRLSSAFPGVPIYVTENGVADKDDSMRKLFTKRYFYAISRAISEGVNLKGYFYWTLMDNFEWAFGFDMRFGLYYVDYGKNGDGRNGATLERTLNPGAKYYVDLIKRFKKK